MANRGFFMAKSRFKITKFKNPSGAQVYRLSGTLNGKRIRENYKSREDAAAKRQEYDIEHLNGQSDGQTVWTTLTHDQNRDAIAAVNILKRAGIQRSLTFAANYLTEHFKEAANQATVDEVSQIYLDARSRDQERGLITARQYDSIYRELFTLKKVFGSRQLDELQSQELKAYLEGELKDSRRAASLKTWNNRRGYLSTFFKFCRSEKYVAEDPVLDVPKFKVRNQRGSADTLTTKQAKDFMHWLEKYKGKQNKNKTWWGTPGCMVPYFALTLFAGIRPDYGTGEMGKLRQEHIRFDTDVILIEPAVSKVREKRSVKIQPNLRAWLEKYPLDRFPIIPDRRFRAMFMDVRKHWSLPHDVMRHTFISMTVGAFRSVGDAALQAGNSEAIIRKHYLDLKSVEEADKFWQIVPKGEKLPKMEKKEGRYVPVAA